MVFSSCSLCFSPFPEAKCRCLLWCPFVGFEGGKLEDWMVGVNHRLFLKRPSGNLLADVLADGTCGGTNEYSGSAESTHGNVLVAASRIGSTYLKVLPFTQYFTSSYQIKYNGWTKDMNNGRIKNEISKMITAHWKFAALIYESSFLPHFIASLPEHMTIEYNASGNEQRHLPSESLKLNYLLQRENCERYPTFSAIQLQIANEILQTHLFLCNRDAMIIRAKPKAWRRMRRVSIEKVRYDWETAKRMEHLLIGSFFKSSSNAVKTRVMATQAAATALCQTEHVRYQVIGNLSLGFLNVTLVMLQIPRHSQF